MCRQQKLKKKDSSTFNTKIMKNKFVDLKPAFW